LRHYIIEENFERTFAIIKPDAVGRGQQGEILARIHKAGFKIVAIKSMRLTKEEAGGFYYVHRERPFYGELTDFMSSGKIFAMVLEADGVIAKWRDTMGATDPKKAAPGTIRRDLASATIACMAPMRRRQRRLRSAIFSLGWN
jgi:nucleoside-diphosphate kinase